VRDLQPRAGVPTIRIDSRFDDRPHTRDAAFVHRRAKRVVHLAEEEPLHGIRLVEREAVLGQFLEQPTLLGRQGGRRVGHGF
jgi:hypothetical protein